MREYHGAIGFVDEDRRCPSDGKRKYVLIRQGGEKYRTVGIVTFREDGTQDRYAVDGLKAAEATLAALLAHQLAGWPVPSSMMGGNIPVFVGKLAQGITDLGVAAVKAEKPTQLPFHGLTVFTVTAPRDIDDAEDVPDSWRELLR